MWLPDELSWGNSNAVFSVKTLAASFAAWGHTHKATVSELCISLTGQSLLPCLMHSLLCIFFFSCKMDTGLGQQSYKKRPRESAGSNRMLVKKIIIWNLRIVLQPLAKLLYDTDTSNVWSWASQSKVHFRNRNFCNMNSDFHNRKFQLIFSTTTASPQLQ